MSDEIIELLSDLEHRQWISWASEIGKTEEISEERFQRWVKCSIPYAELSEEMKEHDRKWARKILDSLTAAGYVIEKGAGVKELEDALGWRDIESAPKDNGKQRFTFPMIVDAIWGEEQSRWVLARELKMDYLPAKAKWTPDKGQ